jgi:hypothetical protein
MPNQYGKLKAIDKKKKNRLELGSATTLNVTNDGRRNNPSPLDASFGAHGILAGGHEPTRKKFENAHLP